MLILELLFESRFYAMENSWQLSSIMSIYDEKLSQSKSGNLRFTNQKLRPDLACVSVKDFAEKTFYSVKKKHGKSCEDFKHIILILVLNDWLKNFRTKCENRMEKYWLLRKLWAIKVVDRSRPGDQSRPSLR